MTSSTCWPARTWARLHVRQVWGKSRGPHPTTNDAAFESPDIQLIIGFSPISICTLNISKPWDHLWGQGFDKPFQIFGIQRDRAHRVLPQYYQVLGQNWNGVRLLTYSASLLSAMRMFDVAAPALGTADPVIAEVTRELLDASGSAHGLSEVRRHVLWAMADALDIQWSGLSTVHPDLSSAPMRAKTKTH